MNKKSVMHDELENLYFREKVFKPNYNLSHTDKFCRNLMLNFLKKNEKKITKNNYNLISIIFQDFFWQYCFNYIKYKPFVDKYGTNLIVNLKPKRQLFNGYQRLKSFLYHKNSIKEIFMNNFKIIYLYFWTIFNLILGNKNKIIVSKELIKNYRYNFFKNNINEKDLLVLNVRLSGIKKFHSKNINEALINNIENRINQLKHWKFVFKYLKPSKIILMDNLDKDYSILLAAKTLNIKTIGVTHGVVSKYHKWLYGFSFIKNKKILKFDKLYVADEIYKNTLINFGNIYKNNQIEISGLLGNIYPRINKHKSNKFILYPYEFLTDFPKIISELKFFKKKGYEIIIKKRSDIKNYQQFLSLDPVFVKDFDKNHFENALCIFGVSSSILYELVFSNVKIVSLNDCGLNLYQDIKLPNLLFFDNKNLNNIIKYKKKLIKPNPIRKKFINEFTIR